MPGNLDRCQTLPPQKKDTPKTVLEKTHPPIDERVKNIQLTLKDLDSESIIGALGKARFDKFAGALPTPKSKTR